MLLGPSSDPNSPILLAESLMPTGIPREGLSVAYLDVNLVVEKKSASIISLTHPKLDSVFPNKRVRCCGNVVSFKGQALRQGPLHDNFSDLNC